jgi:hypothetical protein
MPTFLEESMTKKKLYTLTDEHRAELEPWAKKWIANAMRTRPMDEWDRKQTREAIKGLYRAADLTPPPDHRIVFVPSPFVLRFAAGFASAIWYLREQGLTTSAATRAATRAATYAATYAATSAATRAATSAATRAATDAATRAATYAATDAATYAATYAATSAATRAATRAATYAATSAATDAATDAATYAATSAATDAATDAATYAATSAATDAATYAATDAATSAATRAATDAATRAATYAATDAATYAATYAATSAATDAATDAATYAATRGPIIDGDRYFSVDLKGLVQLAEELGVHQLGLRCAEFAYSNMWQGGNQWSDWDSFLSFFRHVAKLDIDYSKWEHWETASLHSGPRVMHKEFCLVSDFPDVLQVDERNRPHSETGPFCRWADGAAIYALHGVYVPVWAVETPKDEIDPKKVLALENTEQRYAIMRHLGLGRFLGSLNAQKIDADGDYALYHLQVEGSKIGPYLSMRCPSTGREFLEGVGDADKYDNVDPTIKTCQDALAWRFMRASKGKMKSREATIFQA